MQVRIAILGVLGAALLTGCGDYRDKGGEMSGKMMEEAPFGDAASVNYANQLWAAMARARMVGADAINGTPYTGQHPHGAILDTVETTLQVGGRNGALIVKRNYGGEGVSKQKVADDPRKWLGAVTVMFERERGYDPDNQDWFWAKYLPDGSLDKNPAGKPLAGRVAKGMDAGCIACHRSAPGGDLVFNHDRHGSMKSGSGY